MDRPLEIVDLQLEPMLLRQGLEARYDVSETRYKIGAGYFKVLEVADGYALLDDAEEAKIPYWAEVWPSSLALAAALQSVSMAEKKCLELGAGLGLGSCVAAGLGGEVITSDYLVEPLAFAKVNASLNQVQIEPRLLDWTKPLQSAESFDIILAADVLYSKVNIEPVARTLIELLQAGGLALLSDPQRNHLPSFLNLMSDYGASNRRVEREVELGGRKVLVDVYTFSLSPKALRL